MDVGTECTHNPGVSEDEPRSNQLLLAYGSAGTDDEIHYIMSFDYFGACPLVVFRTIEFSNEIFVSSQYCFTSHCYFAYRVSIFGEFSLTAR